MIKLKKYLKIYFGGNVDIYPYKYYSGSKKETPCEYCEFKKICKHSQTKNKFRIIKK